MECSDVVDERGECGFLVFFSCPIKLQFEKWKEQQLQKLGREEVFEHPHPTPTTQTHINYNKQHG
jgi:hypothetical protein